MGVDARMFVRLKGRANWLAAAAEAKTAYDLASTMGAGNFIITATMKDWPFPKRHAISIMRPIKDPADAEDHGLPPQLVGSTVWTQDGDWIIADHDEQFVEVHLAGRYYGEDYARGDWPAIRSIIEWLNLRFPAGEVWYGGDSSGVCAEQMTPERVAEVNRFYLQSGNKTYQRSFASMTDRVTGQAAPTCPVCQVMAINCGGGQGETFWYCDGCDQRAVTSRTATRWLKRGEDFFERNKLPVSS